MNEIIYAKILMKIKKYKWLSNVELFFLFYFETWQLNIYIPGKSSIGAQKTFFYVVIIFGLFPI